MGSGAGGIPGREAGSEVRIKGKMGMKKVRGKCARWVKWNGFFEGGKV